MNNYSELLKNIGQLMEDGRNHVARNVNSIMIQTYWEIGRNIIEYEQKGKERAEYGTKLLDKLAFDLKGKLGKGFSRRNLLDMRRFFIKYPKIQTRSGKSSSNLQTSAQSDPKWQTLSAELSWSHYIELLSLDDLERGFYEKECIKEKWSVRELKRQINSSLFERLALSKDKKQILELVVKGQEIAKPRDIIKDPYVLEFLELKENISEKKLESKIIEHIPKFILEMGKGFTFVGKQYRISSGNNHYYVDLVFYNRILRCFVLIDLKIGEVTPQDIGQMNFYLNYFEKEENNETETKPIGIILAAGKGNINVEYALGGITNNLFVSKYKLYIPDKLELQRKLNEILKD